MLFSCLVDADFIETDAFYAELDGDRPTSDGFTALPVLRDRLQAYMAIKRDSAAPTSLYRLRAEILDHAIGKAGGAPGLFTLTVPTGGGKTLASLSFALRHAKRHGLRHIIYVIPFTGARIETMRRERSRRR